MLLRIIFSFALILYFTGVSTADAQGVECPKTEAQRTEAIREALNKGDVDLYLQINACPKPTIDRLPFDWSGIEPYSIKSFSSGMTKRALREFAKATGGAVFLDEGDYYKPFGSGRDARLPTGVSKVDFNFCGAPPRAASYNDSILSKTENILSTELHEKCLEDHGKGSYTVAGVPLDEVTREMKDGEERFEAGVYRFTCVDLNILTIKVDYEQVQESVISLREAFERKFGRSSIGDTSDGKKVAWDRGWSESYPDRYEALTMSWNNYRSGSRLAFRLRDCRYSKDEGRAEVDSSDI